nr:hypothetical protein [Rhodococcus sp. CC-R104]
MSVSPPPVTTPSISTDAAEHSPLLERPEVRPAGVRDVLRDLGAQYVTNGVIGFVFSASGPIAVTLAVGAAGGLTGAQLASWVSRSFSPQGSRPW